MAPMPVFKNLAELEAVHVRQSVEIFAAGFFEPLPFISSNVDVIANVLEHSLVLDNHYVAVLDDNVVGVVSISNAKSRAYNFQRDILIAQLGFMRGRLAFRRLRNALLQELHLKESQCYIDLVTTDSAFRGLGISTEMQRYLFNNLPYAEYLLEVAEMNFNAIRVYEELGFIIEERKPEKSFWKSNSMGGKLAMRKVHMTNQVMN